MAAKKRDIKGADSGPNQQIGAPNVPGAQLLPIIHWWCQLAAPREITGLISQPLLELHLPYDPSCPLLGWLVRLLVVS